MKYKILGNTPLTGPVSVSGAKNSALKILVSSILCGGELEIFNVPKVGDVMTFIEILGDLGVSAEFRGGGCLVLNSANLNSYKLPDAAKKIKSSVLFVGPLLARFGQAQLPKNPKYNLDFHFDVLKSLGVSIKENNNSFEFECAALHSSDINFLANTHTGTDSAILSSVLAEGTTVVTNAAEEPEIDDLIAVLNKMGAKIKRSEQNSRVLVVEGVRSLGKAEHIVMPDRNEPVFYAAAAIFTNGNIVIKDIDSTHLTSFLSKLSSMGINFEVISQNEVRIWTNEGNIINPTDIETKPYPGFMADWQPFFSVLLTKARGDSLVSDTVLGRFEFAKELNRMEAKIELSKKSLRIKGPSKLKGTSVEALDAISGAALIVAGLGAKGKTEVCNAEVIDAGFENVEEKMKNLGASIARLG